MKFGLKQWRKEAPKEVQGIAGLLLAEGAVIGSYGLASNISWAGYVGLGCTILGTLLEKLTAISEDTQSSIPDPNTDKQNPVNVSQPLNIVYTSDPPDTPGPGDGTGTK